MDLSAISQPRLHDDDIESEDVSMSPMNLCTGSSDRKASHRRNAWGNLSYADLITQAITSAPDKRLSLNQIYEYLVENIPYFRDKGDNKSSAGWKNSIRHNLSLHKKFIRVENGGVQKSSWWMINPDVRPKCGSIKCKSFAFMRRLTIPNQSQLIEDSSQFPSNSDQETVYINSSRCHPEVEINQKWSIRSSVQNPAEENFNTSSNILAEDLGMYNGHCRPFFLENNHRRLRHCKVQNVDEDYSSIPPSCVAKSPDINPGATTKCRSGGTHVSLHNNHMKFRDKVGSLVEDDISFVPGGLSMRNMGNICRPVYLDTHRGEVVKDFLPYSYISTEDRYIFPERTAINNSRCGPFLLNNNCIGRLKKTIEDYTSSSCAPLGKRPG